jgi:competence protein ComEA
MKNAKTPVSKILSLSLCLAVLACLFLAVPTLSVAAKKDKGAKTEKPAAAAVDVNSADEKTIAALPGIGKKTAKEIIAGRPYKNIDDLKKVKGMTDAKLKGIENKITVGAAAAPAAAPAAAAPAAKAEKTQKAEKAPKAEKASKETGKLAAGEKVNINTASKDQLDKLPGIGAVKAQAIIDGRPYSKPEDIMKVKGIKEKQYEKIKDLITVR